MLTLDLATGLLEHLPGTFMQDIETHFGHDIVAGPPDFLHLVAG